MCCYTIWWRGKWDRNKVLSRMNLQHDCALGLWNTAKKHNYFQRLAKAADCSHRSIQLGQNWANWWLFHIRSLSKENWQVQDSTSAPESKCANGTIFISYLLSRLFIFAIIWEEPIVLQRFNCTINQDWTSCDWKRPGLERPCSVLSDGRNTKNCDLWTGINGWVKKSWNGPFAIAVAS